MKHIFTLFLTILLTVSLLAGQTVLVTGIDVGAVYTITELDREGYQLGGIVSESTTAAIQGATIRDTVAENNGIGSDLTAILNGNIGTGYIDPAVGLESAAHGTKGNCVVT